MARTRPAYTPQRRVSAVLSAVFSDDLRRLDEQLKRAPALSPLRRPWVVQRRRRVAPLVPNRRAPTLWRLGYDLG